jgi:hypothetical protein
MHMLKFVFEGRQKVPESVAMNKGMADIEMEGQGRYGFHDRIEGVHRREDARNVLHHYGDVMFCGLIRYYLEAQRIETDGCLGLNRTNPGIRMNRDYTSTGFSEELESPDHIVDRRYPHGIYGRAKRKIIGCMTDHPKASVFKPFEDLIPIDNIDVRGRILKRKIDEIEFV